MTELNILEPAMRRLFEEVDFASVPLSSLAQKAAALWREQSGVDNVAPAWSRIRPLLPANVGARALVFEGADGDYRLHWQGPEAQLITPPLQPLLSVETMTDRRLAVRLRRTLNLVKSREEPATVRFSLKIEGQRNEVELFLAPVTLDQGRRAFFGVIAMRRERHAW